MNQTKHDSESAARQACLTLDMYHGQFVSIILSNGIYYVETGEGAFVRNWEQLIYEGMACDA